MNTAIASPRPNLAQVVADEASRRRRRRLLVWTLACVGLAGIAGVATAMRPRPAVEAERYRSAPARRGALVHEVGATGHLEARGTVSVGAEISGRIASVEVDFNDRVVRGQVLARFDKTSLDAEGEQARASLRVARSTLREAEVTAAHVERERRRVEALYLIGAVSTAERDVAVANDEQSRARVASARAQVGLQHAGGHIIDTNLARAEIHSPIDGVVIRRAVEPGQTVAAALQAPELFLLAEDLTHMEVRAAVDEADIGQVRAGQRAQFSVDAYPDETFAAVVTTVHNAPDLTQNVVTYEAVLAVDNPELKLRPGMTASIRVITAEQADALLVPNAALRFTPPGHEDSRKGGHGVFVVGDGDVPRFVPLVVGITDGMSTAVDGDLAVGTAVLVDLAAAKPGKQG